MRAIRSTGGAIALATVAAVAVGSGPAPNAHAVQCAASGVPAVIAGKSVCLVRGKRCSKRLDRQYHRYRFHCHSGRLTGGPAPPVPRAGKIAATISVPSSGGIAFGAGAVWVANVGPHTVTRLDPQTNAIVATIPVGEALNDPLHGPAMLAFDFGSLWVLNGGAECGCVQRIDPTTNRVVATISLGSPTQFRVAPLGIATTPTAVWVTHRWGTEDAPAGAVVRIDPATDRVAAIIGIGGSFDGTAGPTGIAADSKMVWVGVPSLKSVVQIDPQTNSVVRKVPGFTCAGGQLALDESGVWVADCDAVRHVDAATGAIRKTVVRRAGNGAVGVGVAYGSLWVQDERLLRLDPSTGSVTGAMRLSQAFAWSEQNLSFGLGAVWVRRVDKVFRIEPTPE